MWWACQGLFRVGSGTAQGRLRGATTPTSSPWAAPAGADGSGAGGGGHRRTTDAPSPTAAEDDRSALGRRPAGPSRPQPPTARRRGGRRPPRMTGLPGAGCRAGVDMVTGSSARGRTIVHRLWTAEYEAAPVRRPRPVAAPTGRRRSAGTPRSPLRRKAPIREVLLSFVCTVPPLGVPCPGRGTTVLEHRDAGRPFCGCSVTPPVSVWAAWTFRTRPEHMECRAPGRLDRHDHRDGDRLPLTAGQVPCRAHVR